MFYKKKEYICNSRVCTILTFGIIAYTSLTVLMGNSVADNFENWTPMHVDQGPDNFSNVNWQRNGFLGLEGTSQDYIATSSRVAETDGNGKDPESASKTISGFYYKNPNKPDRGTGRVTYRQLAYKCEWLWKAQVILDRTMGVSADPGDVKAASVILVTKNGSQSFTDKIAKGNKDKEVTFALGPTGIGIRIPIDVPSAPFTGTVPHPDVAEDPGTFTHPPNETVQLSFNLSGYCDVEVSKGWSSEAEAISAFAAWPLPINGGQFKVLKVFTFREHGK